MALALIFDYLLLFQLLSLYHHFDYHYLSILYPEDSKQKKADLLKLLRGLSLVLLIIEIGFTGNFINAVIMTIFFWVIAYLYLPYKLKNIID